MYKRVIRNIQASSYPIFVICLSHHISKRERVKHSEWKKFTGEIGEYVDLESSKNLQCGIQCTYILYEHIMRFISSHV